VDRHQRHIAPRTGRVQCPRHYFLARAALPGDQNGGLGGRHHLYQFHHLFHGGALADQLRAGRGFLQILAQPDYLAPRPLVLQRVGYQVRKLVRIHRLGDVVVGAHFEGLHCRLHGRIAGHDNDRELRIGLPQARLQLHAVHARHLDVEESNIEFRLLDHFQRLTRAGYRPGREPFAGKPFAQRVPHHQLIVDDQYFTLGLYRSCRVYGRCHWFLPLTSAAGGYVPSNGIARAAVLTRILLRPTGPMDAIAESRCARRPPAWYKNIALTCSPPPVPRPLPAASLETRCPRRVWNRP